MNNLKLKNKLTLLALAAFLVMPLAWSEDEKKEEKDPMFKFFTSFSLAKSVDYKKETLDFGFYNNVTINLPRGWILLPEVYAVGDYKYGTGTGDFDLSYIRFNLMPKDEIFKIGDWKVKYRFRATFPRGLGKANVNPSVRLRPEISGKLFNDYLSVKFRQTARLYLDKTWFPEFTSDVLAKSSSVFASYQELILGGDIGAGFSWSLYFINANTYKGESTANSGFWNGGIGVDTYISYAPKDLWGLSFDLYASTFDKYSDNGSSKTLKLFDKSTSIVLNINKSW